MSPTESRDPRRVRAMFGAIAGRYDLLNHLLSLNLDRRWRRRAARALGAQASWRVLDLCGGTGDLTLEVARLCPEGLVVCCDFSPPMLRRAGEKFLRRGVSALCPRVEADALRLPFASESFDGVTVAFGIRNFEDLDRGLGEALRVLRPGGRLVVLEFSTPQGPVVSALYHFYLRRILPRVGDGIAGRPGPYLYLARTIAEFPDPALLAGRIREAGFAAVGWVVLSGGIVAIHSAIKSPR